VKYPLFDIRNTAYPVIGIAAFPSTSNGAAWFPT
jgi:hypothetical protein